MNFSNIKFHRAVRKPRRKARIKKKNLLLLYFYSLNLSPLWKTPPGKLTIHITDNTVKFDLLN